MHCKMWPVRLTQHICDSVKDLTWPVSLQESRALGPEAEHALYRSVNGPEPDLLHT